MRVDEYTPTTEHVRIAYVYATGSVNPRWTEMSANAEFDAWLAAHDADVERAAAEKAWDTAVEMCCTMLGARNVNWPNPYRADRLAGGEA